MEVNLDEMDLTAAEGKAVYEEIKAYVLEQTGLRVSCRAVMNVLCAS